MIPTLYSLPYNRLGELHKNRVIDEMHDISKYNGMRYRIIVLEKGYFFTDNLLLRDNTGYVLNEGDYHTLGISAEASTETGKETASVIVIDNPRVTSVVYVSATMVGGRFCNLDKAIQETSLRLLNPERNPNWKNIANKPDDYEVGGHLHALWELFGFEDFVTGVNNINVKIKNRSDLKYQNVLADFQNRLVNATAEIAILNNLMNSHYNSINPHNTNKNTLGLGAVVNMPVISDQESNTYRFNNANRYLVVGRFRDMIRVNLLDDLREHVADRNNPHRTTADQISVYSKNVINQRVLNYLERTMVAASASKYRNITGEVMASQLRSGLNADEIKNGVMPSERLTDRRMNANHYISGANTSIDLRSKIRPLLPEGRKILALSYTTTENIVTILNSTFSSLADYPVGTLAFNMYYYDAKVGYGNGTNTYTAWLMSQYVREAAGWVMTYQGQPI